MIKNSRRQLLFLLLVAFFVVCCWFSNSQFIATGEEALWLWAPLRSLRLFSSPWLDVGFGMSSPFYLPRLPLLILMSAFQLVLNPWLSQALLFFLLLVSGLWGCYFLARELFSPSAKLPSLMASLFYLFNLYSLTQIWNRFLTTGFFAWAYLPIFTLLWLRWLKYKRKSHLVYFLVSSLVFSNVYGAPAFVFALWSPALIWSVLHIKSISIIRLMAGLVGWMLINSWWLVPYFQFSHVSSPGQAPQFAANFSSLQAVSQFFPSTSVLLLRQEALLRPPNFHGWYYTSASYILSWLGLFLVLVGFIRLRRSPLFAYLLILFALGWFVSKGTNPPLGHSVFKIAFFNLSWMQLLRNSYEKFGLVLVLPYSLLIGSSLILISRFRFLISILVILLCGILVWPMWTGDVFGAGTQNTRLSVPDYYLQANRILNSFPNDGRVLMLPIVAGDAAKYDWSPGYYQGIDPSEFLFDREVISRTSSTQPWDSKYFQIFTTFINRQDLMPLLSQANVKYLLLRGDLNSQITPASTSAQVLSDLSAYPQLTQIAKIGPLTIYDNIQLENPSLLIPSDPRVTVTYHKIRPEYYLVNLSSPISPYQLIFKSSYDSRWTATLNNKTLVHSKVYDYANSWQVSEIGNLTIQLRFNMLNTNP